MRECLRNGKLRTLMLGHLTVDSYVGVIPVLYPILIGRFHLSLATVGLVSLAYGGMAAVSQPLFGVLADRFGTRFTGLALCWTALTFSLVGFVSSFPLLLLLALAWGLGSGASHPVGALDVRALLPRWRRSAGMSVYVTAGTVGVAIGPLVGILVFGAFGIHGTGVLIVPGLITGGYLLWRMRGRIERVTSSARSVSTGARVPLFALAIVIGAMMARSWAVRGGLASARVMGLGFVAGASGTPTTGARPDSTGLQNYRVRHVALVLPTTGIAWFLPTEPGRGRLATGGEIEPTQSATAVP